MLTWQRKAWLGAAKARGEARRAIRTCQPRELGWGRQRRMLRCHRQRRLQGMGKAGREGGGRVRPLCSPAGGPVWTPRRTWRVQRCKQGAEKENQLHCVHPAKKSGAGGWPACGICSRVPRVCARARRARRRRTARAWRARASTVASAVRSIVPCRGPGRPISSLRVQLQATIPAEHPCGHPLFRLA